MKRITLLLMVFCSTFSFGQIIITELADPNDNAAARYVEIYNVSTSGVDLTGWELRRWTNATTDPQATGIDLSTIETLDAGEFAIIAANGTEFQNAYQFAPDISAGTGGAADSNGDDQIAIFDASDVIVDIFGVPGEDGSGTCHEFEDGRAERIASVTASASTWNEAEWNVWADSAVTGCTSHTQSPQNADGLFDPGTWIGATSEPSLTASASAAVYQPGTTSVDVTFSVNNFTLGGDNVVEYIINGGAAQTTTTNPISISVADGQSYTVTLELKDAGGSLNPQVLESVTFSVAVLTDVADLSSLRQATRAIGDYFTITGETVLTFQQASRNQKYIQDASGAILIDDANSIITTPYNVGDGITGISGQLSEFNGVLQFIPIADPGAASSTANTITPQQVTFTELTNDLESYESEIVQVVGVNFTGITAGDTFAQDTNYTINDGSTDFTLRSTFDDSDIIGTEIPTTTVDITGVASEFNGTSQIFPRNLADISGSTLSNATVDTNSTTFTIYPNPVFDGVIYFSGIQNNPMEIRIFNVLGAKVAHKKLNNSNNQLDVSSLTTGVYLVQLFENNKKLTTQKLIIR